jgi:hypothetical protein
MKSRPLKELRKPSRRDAIKCLVAGTAALGALHSGCAGLAPVPSPSDLERGHPATNAWQLARPAMGREIEGYASQASVNRGESIELFVNSTDPNYSIEIYRIGWYGGKYGLLMMHPIQRQGRQQLIPSPDPNTGLIECQWEDPYLLQIPISKDPAVWPSGVYLAKLTGSSSRAESYIHFVVRDDDRRSALLFQTSVTTYQAYNEWGGMSLYSKPTAYEVSFNRPYQRGHGSGDFLFWEYSLLRFLERNGYDVTYTTDVDTHTRGHLILRNKAFLSVGHDEYWSWEMRDALETALAQGVHLGFFGANIGYWQARFEPSLLTGQQNRTLVCYKKKAYELDPFASHPDPLQRRRTTTQFRMNPVNRPENELIGVMYESHQGEGDIVISDASSWVFDGTNLVAGDVLPGLLGYEADRIFPGSPPQLQRFAHSPYEVKGERRSADMTYYVAPSGATVVATGSMQWNWGLDESFSLKGRTYAHPGAMQMTRNFLARFGAHPQPMLLSDGTDMPFDHGYPENGFPDDPDSAT